MTYGLCSLNPCETVNQARTQEHLLCEQYDKEKLSNQIRPIVSKEEWKEYQREYNLKYRQENAEKLQQYGKKYYNENKERVNERKKQYSRDNAEKIREHKKQYRQENVDKIKERRKIYRENNKDRIDEINRQKSAVKRHCSVCDCMVRQWAIKRHERSKKHQDNFTKQAS